MTRSDLVKNFSARYPAMFLKDMNAIFDVIFDEISNALVEKRRVEIRGFGAFTIRTRRPRVARNPRTNEVVELKTRYSPYFRAGKELRVRLNRTKAAS